MAQNNQNGNGKNQNNGSANYNGFNTAAGIAPKSTLEFTYTTQDIQEFVRKRLAAIVGSDVDNYAFCAYSEAYGKKYVPITLLIEANDYTLARRGKGKSGVSAIFDADASDDEYARLSESLLKAIAPFFYTKDDRKGFDSPVWKQTMESNRYQISQLKYFSSARLVSDPNQKGEKGKQKYIKIVLDPIRIAYYMSMPSDQNNSGKFAISITDIRRIDKYSVSYEVKRRAKGKGKHNHTNISDVAKALMANKGK